jgi:hypothetical protein
MPRDQEVVFTACKRPFYFIPANNIWGRAPMFSSIIYFWLHQLLRHHTTFGGILSSIASTMSGRQKREREQPIYEVSEISPAYPCGLD